MTRFRRHVATYANLKNPGNYHDHNDFRAFHSWNFGLDDSSGSGLFRGCISHLFAT